jgi:hypothetical protein
MQAHAPESLLPDVWPPESSKLQLGGGLTSLRFFHACHI